MTSLLALETSHKTCSVALLKHKQVTQLLELTPQRHSQKILLQIQQLLLETQTELNKIDAVAFSAGPGSFTGIRLAASLIQGLTLLSHTPVLSISSLQVLAQGAYMTSNTHQIIVSTNAYRGKIYWGVYQLDPESGTMQAQQLDCMCSPEEASLPDPVTHENWIGIGDAWGLYPKSFKKIKNSNVMIIEDSLSTYTQARYVAHLAAHDFLTQKNKLTHEAIPIYLYGSENWHSQ